MSRPEASGHLRPAAAGPTCCRVVVPSPVVASYAGRNFLRLKGFGLGGCEGIRRLRGGLDLGLEHAGQAGAGLVERPDELAGGSEQEAEELGLKDFLGGKVG